MRGVERVISLLVAGATIVACAQIAGIDDTAAPPAGNAPPDADGGVVLDPSQIVITPSEDAAIDIGQSPCGTNTAAKQPITILNNSKQTVSYAVTIPEGSAFHANSDARLTGSLAPGVPASVVLFATPAATGDVEGDVLVSVGTNIHQTVHLKASGVGATMRLGQSAAAFGDVRFQDGATTDVTIFNDGTQDLVVSDWTPTPAGTDFVVDWAGRPTALRIAPNTSAVVHVTLPPSSAPKPGTPTTFAPTVEQPFCGATPTLAASGNRVNADVIVTAATFGAQPCGSTPASAAMITITNHSTTKQMTVNASLANTTGLFTLQKTSVPVPVAPSADTPSVATIGVTATKLPTDTFDVISDAVTLTSTGSATFANGQTTTTTTVQVDVHGALLTVTPTSLTFHNTCWSCGYFTCCQQGPAQSYTVKNDGNEALNLSWSTVGSNWSGTKPPNVGARATANGQVNFSGSRDDTRTLTVSNGSAQTVTLCNTPSSISLVGNVN